MAGSPKDYIPAVTADYTATQFNVNPQEVLVVDGSFLQEAVEFDDASIAVMTRSTTPKFYFQLRWLVLKKADADNISDFYFDPLKAKGKARTFEFPHPIDTYTYIVSFWSEMSRELFAAGYESITQIVLKVHGYKAA